MSQHGGVTGGGEGVLEERSEAALAEWHVRLAARQRMHHLHASMPLIRGFA